jgi:hypothetical protein
VRNILKFLGRVGKGGATIAGAVLGLGGAAAAAGNDQLAGCISLLLKQPEGMLTVGGALLLLFGLGRKAGWIAGKTSL